MMNNFTKTKRKGITPIIAIVLLLMMTVAAFGLTFMWVQETQSEIQNSISRDITDVTDKNSAQFNIESIFNNTDGNVSIVLRNTGRYSFNDLSDFSIYLDGKGVNNTVLTSTAFSSRAVKTIKLDLNWSKMLVDTKPHTFKLVSPMSTQTSFTCMPSKTEDGYC